MLSKKKNKQILIIFNYKFRFHNILLRNEIEKWCLRINKAIKILFNDSVADAS